MAAAPEADVSGWPGRPEAPPRAIARRPALTEPAGARRTARTGWAGDRGGRAEALRTGEGFAVGAVRCWEPRARPHNLSWTAPPRFNGCRRAPRLHGDGRFLARTPALGLPRGAC